MSKGAGGAPLDATTLARATAVLAAADPDLAAIVARRGVPPLWDRAPGFPTSSTSSGAAGFARAAAFDRLLVPPIPSPRAPSSP